jgi:hypothetical protein
MGWLHSGQAGASLVMSRTLTERPLRPEATWVGALPWAAAVLTCADGPQAFMVVRRCSSAMSRSYILSGAAPSMVYGGRWLRLRAQYGNCGLRN